MPQIQYKDFGQLSWEDYMVYNNLPPHPFWSLVEKHVDFSFADKLCAPLYSPRGQRPIAPSIKLKIHLIQRYYGLSDRETEMRIIGDLFLKRFLGLPVTCMSFDHSTIALDRSRMGSDLFHACHHYILAQALAKGIWGNQGDRWLVDAFHTFAPVSIPNAHGLILQAIGRMVRHLKRHHPRLHDLLERDLDISRVLRPLPKGVGRKEQLLAFSRLVAHAYALLAWFENEEVAAIFRAWDDADERQKSLELKALLTRILAENTKPASQVQGKDDDPPESGRPSSEIAYVERTDKPQDRIVNAHAPDIRRGAKSKKLTFVGDKVETLVSAETGLILSAEPMAGNASDGQKMAEMVRDVMEHHGVCPREVVADGAYGYPKYRRQMEELGVRLTAPVPVPHNAAGPLHERFRYDSRQDVVICPEGHRSVGKFYNPRMRGHQYRFDKAACTGCPVRSLCTTSRSERSFFISDHYDMMQQAKRYNQSEAGQAALSLRPRIERVHNALKNHHGLKHPRPKSRERFRTEVILTVMVVNIKTILKRVGEKVGSIIRHPSRARTRMAPVCP